MIAETTCCVRENVRMRCTAEARSTERDFKPASDRPKASPEEESMTTVTRRKVLKSGAAVVGGMAGILATGRAPAFAQGTTVHWLRWNDFVPASDQLLRKEMLPEGEKALGIKLNIETINANDIQARVTSAIQSGSGPDVVCVLNNWGQLYGESVMDVSDIADVLGKG